MQARLMTYLWSYGTPQLCLFFSTHSRFSSQQCTSGESRQKFSFSNSQMWICKATLIIAKFSNQVDFFGLLSTISKVSSRKLFQHSHSMIIMNSLPIQVHYRSPSWPAARWSPSTTVTDLMPLWLLTSASPPLFWQRYCALTYSGKGIVHSLVLAKVLCTHLFW